MVLYLAFLGKVFLEDTIMKNQRNIYFKYNTCTIEEHVHDIHNYYVNLCQIYEMLS